MRNINKKILRQEFIKNEIVDYIALVKEKRVQNKFLKIKRKC